MTNLEHLGNYKLLFENFYRLNFSEAINYSKFFEEDNIILILYHQNNELVQFLIKPCGNTTIIYNSKNENVIDIFRSELENLNI